MTWETGLNNQMTGWVGTQLKLEDKWSPRQCASLETSLHLRSVHLSHIPLWPVSSSHWGMWVLDHLKDPQLMMPLTNKKLKFPGLRWDVSKGVKGTLWELVPLVPVLHFSLNLSALLLTVELSQETDHTSHFLTVSAGGENSSVLTPSPGLRKSLLFLSLLLLSGYSLRACPGQPSGPWRHMELSHPACICWPYGPNCMNQLSQGHIWHICLSPASTS